MKESGSIKWEINISATISKEGKISKKEMKDLTKTIAELNELLEKIKQKGDETTTISSVVKGDKELCINANFVSTTREMFVLDAGAEGVSNIIKWFHPNINDRDWDHQYIIRNLRFKIQNTCNYIREKKRHEDWEMDVKYMEIALNLIDRLWPDESSTIDSYESEYSTYHVSKYSFVDIDPTEQKEIVDAFGTEAEGSKKMEVEEISERFDEFFGKNKLMHKKAIEYLKTAKGWAEPYGKFTQALVLSRLKHEKAKKLLFNILFTKIEGWWD